MSAPTLHTIKIIPAAAKAQADAALAKLGRGPNSHSIPLSATGLLPATHYAGCGLEYEAQAQQVDAVKGGQRPSGITPGEGAALGQGQSDREAVGARSPRGHFEAVIAARGLKEIAVVAL